ncbi:ATP-binding protein, partial [bacterium]|nr:ATP-binding protein [bacterium]
MSIAARRSHRGDEYQLRIAVHWLIRLLSDETLEWVQVDTVVLPGDDDIVYVDDVVIKRKDDSFIFTQAKVHQADRRLWSISDLSDEIIKVRKQLEGDKPGNVMFYSQTPFGEFQKLIEDAKHFDNYKAFSEHAFDTLKIPLSELSKIMERNEEEVYLFCNRLEIGPFHTLDDWDRLNKQELERYCPYPEPALAVIERLARKNQSGTGAPVTLSRSHVEEELKRNKIIRAPYKSEKEITDLFKEASQIGRYDLPRKIAGIKIERDEVRELLDIVESGNKNILLTDKPGSGKSWILLEFADLIEETKDWSLLFIKGDRFDDITSLIALQDELAFKDDIPGLAARLASLRKVVVVIDSLDALSLGRDQKALKVFLALLDRLRFADNISIVAACRDFDLEYDPLLRDRDWGK